MPTTANYDSVVAARTRAAAEILSNPDLLSLVKAAGGLESDLEEVVQHGERAHALNAAQSSAAASAKHATLDIAESWATIQGEYVAVMAVVEAVVGRYERAGQKSELVTRLKAILKNEVEVTIREVDIKGEKQKKARRVESYEALRAEIEKDAAALIDLSAAHEALAQRGVTVDRVATLRDGARELAGKLSNRAVKKGTAKSATAEEHAAVIAQREVWADIYRVLLRAGAKSSAIRALLREAAR